MLAGNPTEQLAVDFRESDIRHVVRKPFCISELQWLMEALTAAIANNATDLNE